MRAIGLDLFDKTLQTTHVWLGRLMQRQAVGPDRQAAWHARGAVRRTVRDRISVGLAAHLGAQRPLLLRGACYAQWHAPGHRPQDEQRCTLDALLEPVRAQLAGMHPVYARDEVTAVFGVLSR